jgi:hypothetical protein
MTGNLLVEANDQYNQSRLCLYLLLIIRFFQTLGSFRLVNLFPPALRRDYVLNGTSLLGTISPIQFHQSLSTIKHYHRSLRILISVIVLTIKRRRQSRLPFNDCAFPKYHIDENVDIPTRQIRGH